MEMPKVDSNIVIALIAAVAAFFAVKKLAPAITDKAKKLALPSTAKE